jgi:glycosyltransferase involved in cell wall biosynthesis
MAKISVYLLTHNEERKIEAALRSVAWADEILVIDSESTDKTPEIVNQSRARLINIPFEGFGKLRQRAVSACSHEWIFSLDADERCTPAAAEEIRTIAEDPNAVDAYFIPRRNWFMGRWIRYSGWYPDYRQPQLFRKGSLEFSVEDEVHEGYRINGLVGYLRSPIHQIPFQNFEQILAKANRYSSLGAKKLARKGRKGGMLSALGHGLWSFLTIFFLKRGFLDGWAGFVIALGNFEGTFYRYAKLTEYRRGWDNPSSER